MEISLHVNIDITLLRVLTTGDRAKYKLYLSSLQENRQRAVRISYRTLPPSLSAPDSGR